jgi:Sugar transferases involved in lipopolysaccharide synthesis
MQDISGMSQSAKAEIAEYIKRDNLDAVNKAVGEVHVKDTFYTRYGKRALDIVLSLIAFIITSPINLVIAVVTFIDVGRPIFFKQTRIGMNGKKFIIYKFRNMTNDTDDHGELLPPSQRVTKWGKFVRKTSLDELLNFISILKGDMTIIGPRPLLDYYVGRLNDRHKMMYAVRPGLECPTLHKVGHALSWQERLDNYVWYLENCSLVTDIKLMTRIVELAFDRKATAKREKATNGGIMGYDVNGNVISTMAVPESFVDEFLEAHGYGSLEEAISDRFDRKMKGFDDESEKSVSASWSSATN